MVAKILKNKYVLISISITLILIIASLTTMISINYYRNQPLTKYAIAEQKWIKAKDKSASDTISIDMVINNFNIRIDIAGERTYSIDYFNYNYDITVTLVNYALIIVNTNLVMEAVDDSYNITIDAADGLIAIPETDIAIEKEILSSYINYDFANNIIYNPLNMVIDKQGKFIIDGNDSINYILYQISPIVSNIMNMDFLPMLEGWTTFSPVNGDVYYDEKNNFSGINSNQSFEINLPWEDLDYIAYNLDNFPPDIIALLNTKKITIPNIPLIGSLNINMATMFPEYIPISGTITIESQFNIG